jgi:hypothetical protein
MRTSEDDTTGEGAEESSSSTSTAAQEEVRKIEDFFAIWWNGRLVPLTSIESFDWCSPGRRMDQAKKDLYGRISGSLFFDSSVEEITDNKLNIDATRKLLEIFNEKKIHQQMSTFQHFVKEGQLGRLRRAKGKNIKTAFDTWLKGCAKHDKRALYSELIGKYKIIFKYLI